MICVWFSHMLNFFSEISGSSQSSLNISFDFEYKMRTRMPHTDGSMHKDNTWYETLLTLIVIDVSKYQIPGFNYIIIE